MVGTTGWSADVDGGGGEVRMGGADLIGEGGHERDWGLTGGLGGRLSWIGRLDGMVVVVKLLEGDLRGEGGRRYSGGVDG